MELDQFLAAKRLIFGALLVYVLWLLGGSMLSLGMMLNRQHQEQQAIQEQQRMASERESALIKQNAENRKRAERPKLPAASLEARLRTANAFGVSADARRQMHCLSGRDGWDYTCVYRTDLASQKTWTAFGVRVDDAHIVEMSKRYPSTEHAPAPLQPFSRVSGGPNS